MAVVGSAVVHANLAVEYAENGLLVDGVAAIAVRMRADGSAIVEGTAIVRVRHTIDATNSAAVDGAATTRPRHTLAATQSVATGDSVADVRALYRLAATQDVTVDSVVDARPTIPLAATQDLDASGIASAVPSAGIVPVDATQTVTVEGVAVVRVRHTLTAAQAIEVDESASRDGIHIPIAAAQAISTAGSATVRALYALTAAQAVGVSGSAMGSPSLRAAGSAAVEGTATTRPRHTLAAAGTAVVAGAANVAAVMITRQKMNKSGNQGGNSSSEIQITSWTSDATYPATISSNQMRVVGSGTVTVVAALSTANGGGGTITVRAYKNGTLIGSAVSAASASSVKATIPGVSVAADDLIRVTAQFQYSNFNNLINASGTYLEIAP